MPTENVVRLVTRPWRSQLRYELCNGVTYDSGVGIWQYSTDKDIFRKQRTWVRTPGYRQLRATKQHLPDNPFDFKRWQHEDKEFTLSKFVGPGFCTSNDPVNKMTQYTYWYPTASFGPRTGSQTMSDNALRAKLISNAKGAEWSAPVFIGEARETIGLIANTVRTLASAYRDLRRGDWSGALGSLAIQGTASQRRKYYREFGIDPRNAAANAWLALNYGVRPLLHDVHNAAETLAELANQPSRTELLVRASTRKSDTQVDPDKVMGASPLILAREILQITESFKGVWRFRPTSLNSWGSFGLLNPGLVAWELLPFSFVVDWLLPVGRYCEGLDVSMRFDHLGGSIGYRREVKTHRDQWRYEGTPHEGTQSASYVELNRVPLSGPPSVPLSSIVFDPQLGASRVTSAIALLSQLMSR